MRNKILANGLRITILMMVFLTVLAGCGRQELKRADQEKNVNDEKQPTVTDTSTKDEIPAGWEKATTKLLSIKHPGTINYIVPKYYTGLNLNIDRYFDEFCHLTLSGDLDAGGAPIITTPLNLEVPANEDYVLTFSDSLFISSKFTNGLEFWMRIYDPAYAQQCGQDFIGIMNSIEYIPEQEQK